MHLFKKKEKQPEQRSAELGTNIRDDRTPTQEQVSGSKERKKKIKIGFRHKKSKKEKVPIPQEISLSKEETPPVHHVDHPLHDEETQKKKEDDGREIFLQDDVLSQDNTSSPVKKKEEFPSKKKKNLSQKNMEGKPVYLEDTGEKLGTVFGTIYDGEKNFIGYKIKDAKSDTILSFPFDHFNEDKDGLIFVPSWYVKSMKTIEKLEFKDRISPEITTLLVDETITNDELYNIFLKHDDEMAQYMEEAAALKEVLLQRLKVLEKQRLSLKDNLMDLTEKRLIKDIDRRQFSEDVMEHRRRVNILDVNIKKCKELLERLECTSFGMIRKHAIEKTEPKNDRMKIPYEQSRRETTQPAYPRDNELPYKEKYYELKERFNELEENYNELKTSVEKLLTKNETGRDS